MGRFDKLLSKLINNVGKFDNGKLPVINEAKAKRIAEAYEQMKHAPDDPQVKSAYDALINETLQQFQDLKSQGLKTSPITKEMQNPYKSSKELISDVKDNNHMYYYPTEQGFGTNTVDAASHPLMKATSELGADGKPLLANDLFRVVHDYYGHVKPNSSFGPRGEELAYQTHMPMFSPEAQKALSSETRGQNSWVNFGKHGEANRANPANTIYAEQKAGIMPEWARNTRNEGSEIAPGALGLAGAGGALATGIQASLEEEGPMDRFDQIKKYFSDSVAKGAEIQKQLDDANPMTRINPGDETTPASSPWNLLAEKSNEYLGTEFDPMTIAEEKGHMKNLPQDIGMSAGSIRKVVDKPIKALTGVADDAYKKLKDIQSQRRLDSMEETLLAKAEGRVPVVEPLGQPNKSLGASQMIDGQLTRKLPVGPSMDQALMDYKAKFGDLFKK